MRASAVGGALFLAFASAGGPAAAQLSPNGAKAYDMAHAAEDAARAAHDEGTATLAELRVLKPGSLDAEAVKALQEQGEAAAEALRGYREQAQASVDEALARLADVIRGPREDPARRDQLEHRALLAAYEASVMAARARSQAERLRALHADARAVLAGAPRRPESPPARPAPGSAKEPPAAETGDVVVPNVVGARLDAAAQELVAAGLRLGATTGPREGFVVKQTPRAGARLPRQGTVSVTLSTSAAGVGVPPPR